MNTLTITNESRIKYDDLLNLEIPKISYYNNSVFELEFKIDNLILRETPAFYETELTETLKSVIEQKQVTLIIRFSNPFNLIYNSNIDIYIDNTTDKKNYSGFKLACLTCVNTKNKIMDFNRMQEFATLIGLHRIYVTNQDTVFFNDYKRSTLKSILHKYVLDNSYTLNKSKLEKNDTYYDLFNDISCEKKYHLFSKLIFDELLSLHDDFLSDLLSNFTHTYHATNFCEYYSGSAVKNMHGLRLSSGKVIDFYNLHDFKKDLDRLLLNEADKFVNLLKVS